eukprot:3200778-Amphidinium_carterae.2
MRLHVPRRPVLLGTASSAVRLSSSMTTHRLWAVIVWCHWQCTLENVDTAVVATGVLRVHI